MKIVAIPGSLRKNSYNKMAIGYLVQGAQDAGAEVEILDLKEYALPVYDGDIEKEGTPKNVEKFVQKIIDADSIIICTPEYNYSIPGGLKNAIDWVSRSSHHPFRGKPLALAGTSPGHWGTVRSQMAIIPVLRMLGAHILHTQVFIPFAKKAFDEKGNLTDEKIKEKLLALGKELVEKTKASV